MTNKQHAHKRLKEGRKDGGGQRRMSKKDVKEGYQGRVSRKGSKEG